MGAVMQAEEPDEGEGGDAVETVVQAAVVAEEAAAVAGFRYLGKLVCGCVVTGRTILLRPEAGWHGHVCAVHGGFQKFADVIDARPLDAV